MPGIEQEKQQKDKEKSKSEPKEYNFVLKISNPEGAKNLDKLDQELKGLGLQTESEGRRNGKLKQAIVEQILLKEYPEHHKNLQDLKTILADILDKIDTYQPLAFAYFCDAPFVWQDGLHSDKIIASTLARMKDNGLVAEEKPVPSDYGLEWDTE